MKGTLKRLGDGDYKLYNTDGSCVATTKESPYKRLSVKNCDEIFGIIDVEKLAEEEYREFPTNPKDKPDWHYNRDTNCHRKRKAYIKGFNKAMELNKISCLLLRI